MNKIIILTLLILQIITLTSCKKNNITDQISGKDIYNGELIIADVFSLSYSEIYNTTNYAQDETERNYLSEIVQNNDGTLTTTLTFFESKKLEDNITRSGKIIINWAYNWNIDTTKKINITFDKYSVENTTISGKIIVQLKSLEKLKYKMTENNITFATKDNKEISWNGNKTIEWTTGHKTPENRYDDIQIINFDIKGVNSAGDNFSATGKNLDIDNTCSDKKNRITSGFIEITNITNDNSISVAEFNGCSDTFTINGVQIEQ